jgi:hypothetical protein
MMCHLRLEIHPNMENVQYNPYYDEPITMLRHSTQMGQYYEDILRTIINQTSAEILGSET